MTPHRALAQPKPTFSRSLEIRQLDENFRHVRENSPSSVRSDNNGGGTNAQAYTRMSHNARYVKL